MKGSRFSEEQIIGVLREHEAGAKTEEVCRRHGISSATVYRIVPRCSATVTEATTHGLADFLAERRCPANAFILADDGANGTGSVLEKKNRADMRAPERKSRSIRIVRHP